MVTVLQRRLEKVPGEQTELVEQVIEPRVADGVTSLRRRGRASLEEAPILVPFRFAAPDGEELSLFTTLTTFGTPRDITLDELAVELFYPADDASDAMLRATAVATV